MFYSVYSFYDIELDIIVSSSECEGVINPESKCPIKPMMRSGYRESITTFVSDFYDLDCRKSLNSDSYMLIFQNISQCIHIQRVSSTIAARYYMQVIGRFNMFWKSHVTMAYLDGDNRGIDAVRLYTYDDDNVLKNSTQTYDAYKIVNSLKMVHIGFPNFHQAMYSLTAYYEPESEKCMKFENASKLMKINPTTLMILAIHMCGFGVYETPHVYGIVIQIYLKQSYSIFWRFKQMELQPCKRENSDGKLHDMLSFEYANLLSQTMVLEKQETYVELYETAVKMFYKLATFCSKVEMEYNVVTFVGLTKMFVHHRDIIIQVCMPTGIYLQIMKM